MWRVSLLADCINYLISSNNVWQDMFVFGSGLVEDGIMTGAGWELVGATGSEMVGSFSVGGKTYKQLKNGMVDTILMIWSGLRR